MELSKGQQEWIIMKQEWIIMQKDPNYVDDPLCCEAEIPGGNLIYEICHIKKNDNVNDMTYEQLITWKNYTDEQILDMEFGPHRARWDVFKQSHEAGITENCKKIAISYIRNEYNRKKSHEISLIQEAERRRLIFEKVEKDKIILEKQRVEQFKKTKELAEKEKLKEKNKLIKIQRDKEILEYVDNYIPETNLEKIAYAQYIQNKQLKCIINSQLDYLSSRV